MRGHHEDSPCCFARPPAPRQCETVASTCVNTTTRPLPQLLPLPIPCPGLWEELGSTTVPRHRPIVPESLADVRVDSSTRRGRWVSTVRLAFRLKIQIIGDYGVQRVPGSACLNAGNNCKFAPPPPPRSVKGIRFLLGVFMPASYRGKPRHPPSTVSTEAGKHDGRWD